jgi:hypothetical protein
MKFSERLGHQPIRTQLQIEAIDEALKNSLWSAFLESFLKLLPNNQSGGYKLGEFTKGLWFSFFKLPLDIAPVDNSGYVSKEKLILFLRNSFLGNKNWYEPYDLLQFSVDYADKEFIPFINRILEREKSGYRFVNGELTPITSNTEINEIEHAINSTENIETVNLHLKTALTELADRENPIYRNSVKESISAVEAICKFYTKNDKATLGDALSELERAGTIHPALKKSFSALYGYTSDSGGIRHSLIDNDRQVDFNEAKLILVTCTAFINYMLSKMS